MPYTVNSYSFNAAVPAEIIREVFALAVEATAKIHGKANVNRAVLDTTVEEQTCSINIITQAGKDLSAFFATIAGYTIGSDKFALERIDTVRNGLSREAVMIEHTRQRETGTYGYALWHRLGRGKEWSKIADYKDVGEAADAMELKRDEGVGGSWKVIPNGDNPNVRKRRKSMTRLLPGSTQQA